MTQRKTLQQDRKRFTLWLPIVCPQSAPLSTRCRRLLGPSYLAAPPKWHPVFHNVPRQYNAGLLGEGPREGVPRPQ